jgi:nucleotide-binding universal stress UspA family protein
MKILVPTDFSKPSVNAAEYGANMAAVLNAKVMLLHVVSIPALPTASTLNVRKLEKYMTDDAKQYISLLADRLKSKNKKLGISTHVINDIDLREVIENFAAANHAELIIMGTKGASGLEKLLIGSNTAAVISNSSVPVLAIPETAKFNGIKNIIYASDMLSIDEEIKTLLPLARSLNAGIRVLHILPTNAHSRFDKRELTTELVAKFKYAKISVHTSTNDDIEDGLNEYLASLNVDLLVMFTHHLTFFDKLFRNSATREMAFQSRVPLLAYKKAGSAEIKKIRETEYAMD